MSALSKSAVYQTVRSFSLGTSSRTSVAVVGIKAICLFFCCRATIAISSFCIYVLFFVFTFSQFSVQVLSGSGVFDGTEVHEASA